jgi:hypothetical protein
VPRHAYGFALGVALWGLGASCNREHRPPAVTPIAATAPITPSRDEEVAAEPIDLTPVVLASYAPGSSCRVILRDQSLYWTRQHTDSPSSHTEARGSGARGAALDCASTHGAIHRVDVGGGEEEVVTRTKEWPWALGSTEEALLFVGYCSRGLFSVPFSGGDPKRIGRRDASIIDHVAVPEGVLVADRFGRSTGVFFIDGRNGRTSVVAAEQREPFLLGRRRDRVLWAELDGNVATVFAAQSSDDRIRVGSFLGMPRVVVARDDDLFVLTSYRLVAIGDEIRELATVSSYGDRGSLAVDSRYAYWANGKAGTMSRLALADGVRSEARVGGEPCGVAVDEDAIYWLDRGREAVVRAPLEIFEVSEDSAIDDEPNESDEPLVAPPPGLDLRVEAKPVRLREGWGLDLSLHARVRGPQPFRIASAPAPHLSGALLSGGVEISGFSDGCRTELGADDPEVRPGERRTFTRRHGRRTLEAVSPGETLELQVGLCNVGLPNGRWSDVPAATVVLEVPERGPPKVTVTHAVEH